MSSTTATDALTLPALRRRDARAAARSAASGQTSPSAGRITSLDAVRGLMLMWSVVSASVMTAPLWYDHAPWIGVHPVDLVFPIFVTLTGCGLAFANRKKVRALPAVRRALILLAAGLAYNAVITASSPAGWTGWATFRLTGVLQLYAGVVVFMTVTHLLTRTARGWLVVTAVLAIGHTLLLAHWAASCPGGVLTPACNPSKTIDAVVLSPAHLYVGGARGHDPEGLIALWGACLTASAGASAGHVLLTARQRWGRPLAAAPGMLALAAVLAAGSLSAHRYAPAMKRLWTAPFALAVAACVVVVLLAAHVVLDRAATPAVVRGAAWPALALGRNSLLVYFGSHALMAALASATLGGVHVPWSTQVSDRIALLGHPQVTFSAALLAFWVGLACLLHWRRIYLRP